MKIYKIQFAEKEITIIYERQLGKGVEKVKYDEPEAPSKEFMNTFQSLSPFVPVMYELPESYGAGIEVLSVTFNYKGDNGVMGASISAKKAVDTSNSPALFHTPYTTSETLEDALLPSEKVLPPDCVKILKELLKYASDYINGGQV